MIEIQVFSCHTQNEHDPAKVADANQGVKEHIRPRKELDTRIRVMKSNNESAFTQIGSNTQCQEYPPMSLVTLCKTSIGRHDIAYEKKDCIVEKIGPGMRSLKEASKTDPHDDKWNQEQEYATRTIAPLRQFFDQALTGF